MNAQYRDYLNSDLWSTTRARVLDRDKHRCQACLGKAECVHHRSYKKKVMDGDSRALHWLISLCNACHKHIEFCDNGYKRSCLKEKEATLSRLMLNARGMRLLDWNNKARNLSRNSEYCRRYYQKLKADPGRYAAMLEKKRAAYRDDRGSPSPPAQTPRQSPGSRTAPQALDRPAAPRTEHDQFKEMLASLRGELRTLRGEVRWLKERLEALEAYSEEDQEMRGHLSSIATRGA